MTDPNISQVREALSTLEEKIRSAAHDAVEDFKRATGHTPQGIDIQLVQIQEIGQKQPEYVVGDVTARFAIA